MDKINEICKSVLELQDEDYAEAAQIIEDQKGYFNPLKMATMGWQHELGEHNEKVVAKVKELHEILKAGADIERP